MPVHILPPEISNKIAAGEVVERPASVVKELVENAIDAESSSIQIDIQAGGKRLIRVSDNGHGMSKEDATLAVERHATSKLSEIDDLQKLQTFGFRGEALPSIASVCELELQTRLHQALAGTEILVEGGIFQKVQESGCSPGTQISINNLFYNVPARLKFLKTEMTEMSHITKQVSWAALAHPDISFLLQHNQKKVIDVRPCEDLTQRIRLLYGKEMTENLVEIEAELPNFHLHCWLGKPNVNKSNRNWQLFFLNRRPIRSKILSGALTEATRQTMPKGRHAVAFIFLTMDTEEVDVNVHPAKIEVRFRDERSVYSQMVKLLNKGIYQTKFIPVVDSTEVDTTENDTFERPAQFGKVGERNFRSSSIKSSRPITTEPSSLGFGSSVSRLPTPSSFTPPSHTESLPEIKVSENSQQIIDVKTNIQPPDIDINPEATLELLDYQELQLKANLFNTYILAEAKDQLLLIDQHVASERVLYERLVNQIRDDGVPSQGLLLPITIELTPPQLSVFDQEKDLFDQLGFEIEKFGGQTLIVRSIPSMIPNSIVSTTVTDLIDHLSDSANGGVEVLDVHDQVMTMLSCKSAIKAGDRLQMEEMIHLVKELSQAKHPFNCPHARPIIIQITQRELETRFKRR